MRGCHGRCFSGRLFLKLSVPSATLVNDQVNHLGAGLVNTVRLPSFEQREFPAPAEKRLPLVAGFAFGASVANSVALGPASFCGSAKIRLAAISVLVNFLTGVTPVMRRRRHRLCNDATCGERARKAR
jgi:hypothetical protein